MHGWECSVCEANKSAFNGLIKAAVRMKW